MTVYEKSHTPFWFGAGVTYQIFPDRFCRLEIPDPKGMIGDRWVHEDWDDDPDYDPPDGRWCRDFFGGSFRGVISKLDYLSEMGVSTIYFNPIFESASNHRYNTADYRKIDPMLGTEEDFRELCREANRRGIRIILDGVFSHTGSQSRYFNADGFLTGSYVYPDVLQKAQFPAAVPIPAGVGDDVRRTVLPTVPEPVRRGRLFRSVLPDAGAVCGVSDLRHLPHGAEQPAGHPDQPGSAAPGVYQD